MKTQTEIDAGVDLARVDLTTLAPLPARPKRPRPRLAAEDYIQAARVPERLAPQTFGLWIIERMDVGQLVKTPFYAQVQFMIRVGWNSYTILKRVSWARLHLKDPHEVVMEDSLHELRQHLPIWMAGRGRVLVTGLGLGCVVRGLLLNHEVKHIDVIDIDKDILRVVGHEFKSNPRVTLYHGDALTYHIPHNHAYDYAWHDVHEMDREEHVSVLHAQLLSRFQGRVRLQGAWNFPRFMKRNMIGMIR